MPREVKYRPWDKIDKKMRQVVMLDTYSKFQTVFFNERTSNNNGYRFSSDKCELMEYTGLKDINDREIYEGDIVKWGHLPGSKENPVRIAMVKINPDIQFECLNLETTFEYGCFAYKDTQNALEVIGNIYENPELLQKE